MLTERTITTNSITLYGDFVHNVHERLSNMGLSHKSAYEAIGRYPTLIAHMFTSGRDEQETAEAVIAGYERKR